MKHFVFLTGGLGNQLFQVSSALKKNNGLHEKIFFESKAGNPRINKNGVPEVYDYIDFEPLDSNLKVNKFILKIYNLNLILSSKELEKFKLACKHFVTIISSIAISILNYRIILVCASNGIGFNKKHKISPSRFSKLDIGYFQSHLFTNPSMAKSTFRLVKEAEAVRVRNIVDKANIKEKVVIHVRRGDYKLENDFGLLALEYYSNGIEYFKDLGFKKFIVFSDEIGAAVNLLSVLKEEDLTYFEIADLNSSQVLDIMSYGAGFIIANSTFSWWAGYLRKNPSAIVVAPKKWYALKADPNKLIPEDWVRL